MSLVIDFKSEQVVDESLYRFFVEKQNNNKEIKKLKNEMLACMLFDKPIAKKTIQGDNIVISNADMGAFLNNILDYKQAVKEYQQCSIANEEYYKSILNSILK